jgi:MSHA biogenesis protein MshN
VPAPAKVVIVPAPPTITPLPQAPAAAVPASDTASAATPVASELPAPVQAREAQEPEPAKLAAVHATHQRAHGANARASKERSTRHDKQERKPADHRKAAQKEAAAPVAKPGGRGKEETPSQTAESAYRRGLASIQEGYLSDAIGALEQALQANPHHDAARQTLVRLLMDNKRTDEAIRHLQLALTLDARQPSMAMLLARLQIERGGSGVDTLMRTLPYAGANGEYHAFLAGALQRQQRHREAVEQYQLALRSLPQNGVWLMGLGISLQAEKRDAEALDAFRKARSSGSLSPELASFVDAKIQQLSR